MSLPSNHGTMRGRPPQVGLPAQPNPSLQGWPNPFSPEHLPSNAISANANQYLSKPTGQFVERAGADHHSPEDGVKRPMPTVPVRLSADDKPTRHRESSRRRHESPSKTIFHCISHVRTPSPVAQAGLSSSASRICTMHAHDTLPGASSQQTSRTNAASSNGPRPHLTCRFSHEDYKHIQVMEWLERES